MKKINYHTHTYRCGHGKGKEEDYVKNAIRIHMDEIGFSDHIPLPNYRLHLLKSIVKIKTLRDVKSLIHSLIKNGPSMRMTYKSIEDHLKEIRRLKEIYKDINIYQGFEAEYLEEYLPYYKKLFKEKKIDYLILGNHFNKYCIHSCYYGKNKLTKKEIYQYCENVEKAIETGLFSYIAHPDLFLVGYPHFDEDAQIVSKRICKKAKEYDIPLEINGGGIQRGLHDLEGEMLYLYPNSRFWRIASKIGNKVVIGLDAHKPEDYNDVLYDQLVRFAKELDLNIVDEIKKRDNLND